MKKNTLFLVIASFLSSAVSQAVSVADFNGTWHGDGFIATGDNQWQQKCESASIDIEQTANSFTVRSLHIACGNAISNDWQPIVFTIENSILKNQDQTVGVIGTNSLSIVSSTADEMNSVMSLTVNKAGQLFYQEQISDVSSRGLGFFSISGTLQKK